MKQSDKLQINMKMKKLISLLLALFAVCVLNIQAQDNHSHTNHIHSKGFVAMDSQGVIEPYEFERNTVGDNDILIEIMYSGICHSDIHQLRDEWGGSIFPMVPGHEIAGRVVGIGKNVTKFKVGDFAGVGCMVNSCGICARCKAGEEQYCENNKTVYTYNSRNFEGNPTLGGYSNNIVVTENFALKIPQGADLKRIAPLLCAGATTYSPLRFTHVGKGDKVAIAGFGGLGHLAVQYAVSLGAEVTVFDITEDKRNDALRMGAKKYVNTANADELNNLENSFRVIISTIPTNFNVEQYVRMLKVDGEMVLIGMPASNQIPSVNTGALAGRRKIYGTLIAGIPETQEMLDYSIKHNIYPEIEMIEANANAINQAFKSVLDGKVKFRYVIDMNTLK